MSVLSLYIPIISETISETYIKKTFKDHNIGTILKVDFVKNKEKNRREAFIHFDEWFTTEESKKFQEDIKNPTSKTRFKYTESGKYWPILVNKHTTNRIKNPKYEMITPTTTIGNYRVTFTKKQASSKKQKH